MYYCIISFDSSVLNVFMLGTTRLNRGPFFIYQHAKTILARISNVLGNQHLNDKISTLTILRWLVIYSDTANWGNNISRFILKYFCYTLELRFAIPANINGYLHFRNSAWSTCLSTLSQHESQYYKLMPQYWSLHLKATNIGLVTSIVIKSLDK